MSGVKHTDMQQRDDQELFEKVRQRDEQALTELIRRLSPELFAFTNRMLNNPDDARDILQETFVRVWEKSHQYQERSAVKTWVTSIALNLCYSHLRKQKRWTTVLIDDVRGLFSDSDPQQDMERSYQRSLLEEGLVTLTPRQKAVLTARIYQDLPFSDIAQAVGCSENSAKVHFHEAKKRLGAFVAERTGENG